VQLTNWAGNYTYRARKLHRPPTLERVQEIVASAERVRVLGSRHSFTDIGDSIELLTLADLPADVRIDHAARTVSFTAGLSYGELARPLAADRMALANLASLPHISVAGAVATATHGSGDRNGNLATAVAGLEMVASDGRLVRTARGDPDFDGVVVSLGALGAVTRITLDVEPAHRVSQRVFEGLRWDALYDHFDAITANGYSVSVFTRWGETVDQVWVKSRVADSDSEPVALPEGRLFGAVPATVERNPIPGMDPVNCTPQLGVAGPWTERLPHFRLGFTPSAGEEIQSEYLVPRRHAIGAIEAVRALAGTIRPLLQVSEIRTIAADELWLSPQYRRDTVGIHFTWVRDQEAVERALVGIEAALAPFDARPHWGKLFLADENALAASYERLPDFIDLMRRTDPRGAFRNEWLEARLLGGATTRRP
jgi:xylitol oxidase